MGTGETLAGVGLVGVVLAGVIGIVALEEYEPSKKSSGETSSVYSVPEPSSIGLMAMGAAGLGYYGASRSRRDSNRSSDRSSYRN